MPKSPPTTSPKAAVHRHERAMHPGKPLTQMAKGGAAKRDVSGRFAEGGAVTGGLARAIKHSGACK